MDDKNSLPTRSIEQTMVVSLSCISKQKQMRVMPNGQYWVFNETPDKMRSNENALSLNSSPIHVDELGKLVHGESVGGLTCLRHAGRYPWQPCDREPPWHTAPPGTVTLKKFSGINKTYLNGKPILNKTPLANMWVGVHGGARIHNDSVHRK